MSDTHLTHTHAHNTRTGTHINSILYGKYHFWGATLIKVVQAAKKDGESEGVGKGERE